MARGLAWARSPPKHVQIALSRLLELLLMSVYIRVSKHSNVPASRTVWNGLPDIKYLIYHQYSLSLSHQESRFCTHCNWFPFVYDTCTLSTFCSESIFWVKMRGHYGNCRDVRFLHESLVMGRPHMWTKRGETIISSSSLGVNCPI